MWRLLLAVVCGAGVAWADSQTTTVPINGTTGVRAFISSDRVTQNSYETAIVVYAAGADYITVTCGNAGADSITWQILGGMDPGYAQVVAPANIKAATAIAAAAFSEYTGAVTYPYYLVQVKSTVADTPGTLRCGVFLR